MSKPFEQDLVKIYEAINLLKQKMKSTNDTVKYLSNVITESQENSLALGKRFTVLEDFYFPLIGRVETLEAESADHDSRVTFQENRTDDTAETVSYMERRICDLTSELERSYKIINTLEKEINTLNDMVNTLQNNEDERDNRIRDVEESTRFATNPFQFGSGFGNDTTFGNHRN